MTANSEQVAELVARISEVTHEEAANGAACGWRSCTGCHELNEGHATGPYSDIFGCALGIGCSECGGLGAVWEYWPESALAAMQEEPAADALASMQSQIDAAEAKVVEEREACAQIADGERCGVNGPVHRGATHAAQNIAEKIRARGAKL